jgi:hypothetical protein
MLFGGGGILAALLATVASRDAVFHQWAEKVGIETPFAQLRTTEESVAGRGVFATEAVMQGTVVMTIPEATVLHDKNAALYFPDTANFLQQKRKEIEKKFRRSKRWWNRKLFDRRAAQDFEFADPKEDLWQIELTLYALDILVSHGRSIFQSFSRHLSPWLILGSFFVSH